MWDSRLPVSSWSDNYLSIVVLILSDNSVDSWKRHFELLCNIVEGIHGLSAELKRPESGYHDGFPLDLGEHHIGTSVSPYARLLSSGLTCLPRLSRSESPSKCIYPLVTRQERRLNLLDGRV